MKLGDVIVWAACACHLWPIALGGPVGRCGRCGERPYRVADAPSDGRARPLRGGA